MLGRVRVCVCRGFVGAVAVVTEVGVCVEVVWVLLLPIPFTRLLLILIILPVAQVAREVIMPVCIGVFVCVCVLDLCVCVMSVSMMKEGEGGRISYLALLIALQAHFSVLFFVLFASIPLLNASSLSTGLCIKKVCRHVPWRLT